MRRQKEPLLAANTASGAQPTDVAALRAVRGARQSYPYLAALSVGLLVGASLGASPTFARGLGHGSPESFRGLYEKNAPAASTATTQSSPERGRFGRLFPLGTKFKDGRGRTRILKAHPADIQSLRRLGASGGTMHSKSDADNRDSVIPAGYTFLGQFVDHDITFDTVSSLDKPILDIDSENARSATLDLDSVYGGGPERTPFLYNMPYLLTGKQLATGRYDLLRRTTVTAENGEAAKAQAKQPAPAKVPTPSKPEKTATSSSARNEAEDINNILGIGGGDEQPVAPKAPKAPEAAPKSPENTGTPKRPGRYGRSSVKRDVALIGDPRNDENVVISQIQAGFIAFHNRIVDMLLEKDGVDLNELDEKIANASTLLEQRKVEEEKFKVTREVFERARKHAVHYYHRMLVEDFIPRIIGVDRVQKIRTEGRKFYFPDGFLDRKTSRIRAPFIPVEFSVAAYRYGHAQVRNNYILSAKTTNVPLFGRGRGPDGIDMMGFKPITEPLMIDWRYFFPYEGADKLVQHGRPINTSMPDALFKLVEGGIVPPGDVASLASRNLNRGKTYSLPSGQALARVMKIPTRNIVSADIATRTILNLKETPLWYYILQEAKQQGVEAISSVPHSLVKTTRLAPSSKVYKAAFKTDTQQTQAVTAQTGSAGGDVLGPVGGTIVGEVLLGLIEHYRRATGEGIDFTSEIDALMSSTSVQGLGKIYQMRDLLKDAGVAIPVR